MNDIYFNPKKTKYFFLLVLFFSGFSLNTLCAQPLHKKAPQEEKIADPFLVKEYLLNGMGSIKVFTVSGDVELRSIPNSSKVRIELYADEGLSFWPFNSSMDNYRITSFKKGNEIVASVEFKSKHKKSFWGGETTFSYKITVPESISVDLKTLRGSIDVDNIYGDHLFKSTAGDIRINNVRGKLKAKTSGGDIEINNGRGIIFGWADGGDIRTNNTSGELRLKINAGKIISEDVQGSMLANVSAGDIEARFKEVGKVINLEANAGSINLAIPASEGYALYARGNMVRFDEPRIFKGSYSGNLVDGTINGGGIPINLIANAGTVTFRLKK